MTEVIENEVKSDSSLAPINGVSFELFSSMMKEVDTELVTVFGPSRNNQNKDRLNEILEYINAKYGFLENHSDEELDSMDRSEFAKRVAIDYFRQGLGNKLLSISSTNNHETREKLNEISDQME